MTRRPVFLRAAWRNLVLANYEVPDALLKPHLPAGCELDRIDGRATASLVAFEFLETRVLGVPWPGFRDFPEWNLRFYVRKDGERGVCFVRELVPQAFVCFVARTVYGEPYSPAAIRIRKASDARRVRRRYEVDFGGRRHRIEVAARNEPFVPAADSEEAFYKEQQWGFRAGRRYRVVHPPWRVWPVESWAIDVGWAALYGPEWAAMQGAEPRSVVLAEGSRVAVEWWGGA